jgi:hypothetical protein
MVVQFLQLSGQKGEGEKYCQQGKREQKQEQAKGSQETCHKDFSSMLVVECCPGGQFSLVV